MLDQTLNSLRSYLSQLQGANACLASHQACNFDKSLTPASLGFFVFTLVFFAFSFVLFVKKTKHSVFSVLAVALGVLIFELFTAPMWDSPHMGRFGYIYLDVSWIFTMAWTAAFLTTFSIIDSVFRRLKERVRFFLYLIPMTLYTIALEVFLVAGGIRTYAPEVLEVSLGSFLGVPVEVFYYAPVFSCLIIAFAKFWEHIHRKRPFLPSRRRFSLRNAFILFLAVFAYELLVEPMVQNRGFPTWTYVYQDITAVRVLLWMLVIWVGAEFVDFALQRIRISYFLRFTGYISISTLVLFQIESWFLQHGFREYSQSAVLNFSGFVTPISEIPIEVAFAIPLYLILVVSFLGYWRMTLDYDL